MDEVDRALLFAYSTEDYHYFNKSLREVPPSEKAVKLNDQLSSTLEKLQGETGEFYRGASFSTTEKYIDFLDAMDEQIESQGFFQFKTPTSTSTSGTVAKDFSKLYPKRPHLVFMNIVSKGGAKNITDYTEVPEGECLFSSNCKFKLTGIKVSGKNITMDIEEL